MRFLDHFSRFMAEEASSEAASRGDDMLEKIQAKGNAKDSLYDRLHVSRPTFDQELAAMIESPPPGSLPMEITPAMATVMLQRNDRNRPLAAAKIADYTAQMAAGKWHYTRVPIIFSRYRLIDGQHRLAAVVQSGVTIRADVAFGAPDEAFAFIDVGKKRTAGDIFSIHGVPNATIMAAATQFIVAYDGGYTRGIVSGRTASGAELFDAYTQYEHLQKSAWVCRRFADNRLASPSMMCALHYICARKSRRDADAFFTVAAEGVDARKGDAALALRNTLIRNAASDRKLSRKAVAGLTLVAWNHARRGNNDVRQIKYDVEKPLPVAQ